MDTAAFFCFHYFLKRDNICDFPVASLDKETLEAPIMTAADDNLE